MFYDFEFNVRHRLGKKIAAVDAMSRLETEGSASSTWDMDILTLLVELKSVLARDTATLVPMALSKLIHAQQHDDEVLRALTQGRLHGHAVDEDEDGFIVRKVERPGIPSLLQALVSVAQRSRALKLSYQPHASAHLEVSKSF